MDTGKGIFEQIQVEGVDQQEIDTKLEQAKKLLEEKFPEHGGWFRVGEIVFLKGSKFRVKAVKPTELRLKLLPKD